MFNLFCPTLHVENVLDAETCLSACGSSNELDNLPTQPVVNEQNTAPCGGSCQHKEQDVPPHIASGNVSQAQIPELTRPAMVTAGIGYNEQDSESGRDQKKCYKWLDTQFMLIMILMSFFVAVMKKKADDFPVLPCCKCKGTDEPTNFTMMTSKFGERLKDAYRWTVTHILDLMMAIE